MLSRNCVSDIAASDTFRLSNCVEDTNLSTSERVNVIIGEIGQGVS